VTIAVEPVGAGRAAEAAGLSRAERDRLATMAPRRAAEFARGRSLVRRLAGEVLGLPPAEVPVQVAPGGQLRLAGLPAGTGLARRPAGISLSHSDRYTAAAVWLDGPVGVDVEEPPTDLPTGLLVRCCHAWSAGLADQPAAVRAAGFVRVWTVQEACVKALGRGLAAGPWRIPVDPSASSGRWRSVHWAALDRLTPTALAVAVCARHVKEEP
jgi:4'-phosphopantetheinyl transferase